MPSRPGQNSKFVWMAVGGRPCKKIAFISHNGVQFRRDKSRFAQFLVVRVSTIAASAMLRNISTFSKAVSKPSVESNVEIVPTGNIRLRDLDPTHAPTPVHPTGRTRYQYRTLCVPGTGPTMAFLARGFARARVKMPQRRRRGLGFAVVLAARGFVVTPAVPYSFATFAFAETV